MEARSSAGGLWVGVIIAEGASWGCGGERQCVAWHQVLCYQTARGRGFRLIGAPSGIVAHAEAIQGAQPEVAAAVMVVGVVERPAGGLDPQVAQRLRGKGDWPGPYQPKRRAFG